MNDFHLFIWHFPTHKGTKPSCIYKLCHANQLLPLQVSAEEKAVQNRTLWNPAASAETIRLCNWLKLYSIKTNKIIKTKVSTTNALW